MNESEALNLFKSTGALLDGHFVLRSGLHSRQFFQCALALQYMPHVEQFGSVLADKLRPLNVSNVISPAMGGLVIGQEVARQLKARFIFAEKSEGVLQLRRGFQISEGEQFIIVEDVITQGGRLMETVNIVRSLGGQIAAAAVLVDRSNGAFQCDFPLFSLIQLKVETFPKDGLPDDLKLIPAVHPGSK